MGSKLISAMEKVRLHTAMGDVLILHITAGQISRHPVIMENFIGVLCHSGQSDGTCNLRHYSVTPRSFAINMPGQILQHLNATEDYSCTVIGLSPAFMNSLGFPYNFEITKIIDDSPVIHLSESEYLGAAKYVELVSNAIRATTPFQLEIIKHLTCAAIYGFAQRIIGRNPKTPPTPEEIIVNKFFAALKENYQTTRMARDYAAKLCVSPGYLVSVIKKHTGKTILEWVGEYVVLEAKALLHTSDLSVQQISHRLNFPNQSFFGKYFKKHTGLSPNQYRHLCSDRQSPHTASHNRP